MKELANGLALLVLVFGFGALVWLAGVAVAQAIIEDDIEIKVGRKFIHSGATPESPHP